jgi:histidine triad (HIT) family protein
MDCLFCRMVAGDISPDIVFEDEHVLAFRDIQPQAPVHVLVIPKKHVTSLNDLEPADTELAGRLVLAAQRVARDLGIADDGFRIVSNCNRNGGQTVWHVHVHVLGGRQMRWPPG